MFNRKVRPATISGEEFRRVADLGRSEIMQAVVSSGDSDDDEQLYLATLKRLRRGS